jgi:hypothetical protein
MGIHAPRGSRASLRARPTVEYSVQDPSGSEMSAHTQREKDAEAALEGDKATIVLTIRTAERATDRGVSFFATGHKAVTVLHRDRLCEAAISAEER